jgi:predicted CXXCH cytochrome family protein
MRSRISKLGKKAAACCVVLTIVTAFNIHSADGNDAHEPIKLKKGRYSIATRDGRQEITDVAAYCGECHAEEAGETTGRPPAQAPSHEFGGSGSTHPVEVEYPSQQRGYQPKEDLHPDLVLVDGRMTCLTCHSPELARALVLPAEQSKLCIACHKK